MNESSPTNPSDKFIASTLMTQDGIMDHIFERNASSLTERKG